MDTDRIILLATLFVPTKTQRLAALQKQNTLTPAKYLTSDVLNREKQEISPPTIPSISETPSPITVFKISRHKANLAFHILHHIYYSHMIQKYYFIWQQSPVTSRRRA